MVSGSSRPRAATTATTTVIAPSQRSFQRPERPSERRRETFVQSSTKPIAAHPSVTKNAVTAGTVRAEKMRNGTAIEIMIRRPPIAGVPCLTTWPFGPSSRICCPNSFLRRKSMNLGPERMEITIASTPASRTSTMTGAYGTTATASAITSRPMAREPFTSTQSPGCRTERSAASPCSTVGAQRVTGTPRAPAT